MLFYRQAIALDARAAAERLCDVNAGMAGGRPAEQRLAVLRRAGRP